MARKFVRSIASIWLSHKYSRAASNFSMTMTTILTVNPIGFQQKPQMNSEYECHLLSPNDLQEVVVPRLRLEDSDELPAKEFVVALVLRLNDDSGYSMS